MGATDGLRQWAGHSTTEDTGNYSLSTSVVNNKCIVLLAGRSSSSTAEASFVTWDSTSFTINWDIESFDAGIGTSIFALVLAGENWVAEVGTFATNDLSVQTISTVDNTGVWQGGLFYSNSADPSVSTTFLSGSNLGFWHTDNVAFVNKTKGYIGDPTLGELAQHSSSVFSLTVIDVLGNLEFQGEVDGSALGEFDINWTTRNAETHDFGYIVFHGEDIVISVGEESIVSGVNDITPFPAQLPRALIMIDDGYANQDFTGQGDITFSLGMGELTSDDIGKQGAIYFGQEFVASNANVNGFIAEDRMIQHGDITSNTVLGDVVREGQLDTADYFRVNLTGDASADFYFLSIGEVQ